MLGSHQQPYALLSEEVPQLIVQPLHVFCTLTWTTSPMTPDTWKRLHSPHARLHQRHFDFGILGPDESQLEDHRVGEDYARKIEIRLPRQHKCFSFDTLHCFFEVSVVWFLLRTVSRLPSEEHRQHVVGIYIQFRQSVILPCSLMICNNLWSMPMPPRMIP